MQDSVYVESLKSLITAAFQVGKTWDWKEKDVMDVLTDGEGFGLLPEEFEMAGYKAVADRYFTEDI